MEKDRIVGLLGEGGLLLPDLLNAGLAANDRAKVLFSLLQAARHAADHPEAPPPEMTPDCQAVGLGEDWLVRGASDCRQCDDGYLLPGAARIWALLTAAVEAMLRPLREAAATAPETIAFDQRFLQLSGATVAGDLLPAGFIDGLTRVDPAGDDSLHRLVMDLHKALNRLQAGISRESIDGAAAYGLERQDVPLVRAFMRGVNRTAPLKFDHPGLATTATRFGGKLVIQNDIGTTDAHVLVVHVEGLTASLTYTDIHLERLVFFQALFDGFPVRWQDPQNRASAELDDGGLFHLTVGSLTAADAAGLEAYLSHLGSRLVFLIDWNRARKRLRLLLPKKPVLALLRWAAAENYGHRAFLALGGDRLVFDAITFAAKAPLRYGARLDELLGEAEAVEYLRFVLRTAAEGLLAGRSAALIREEIKAELITRFNSAEEQLLTLAADHAALVGESAMAVRDVLLRGLETEEGRAFAIRIAHRTKDWESQADQLVMQVRALLKRCTGADALRRLVEEADDAIDEVEETSFLLTLLPAGQSMAPSLCASQRDLAGLLVQACQEWVKAVESARHVRRGGAHEDLRDFLEAVDRVAGLEHQADLAERAAKATLLLQADNFRQLQVFTEVAASLEEATDALMRAALILREHVMSDVITM